ARHPRRLGRGDPLLPARPARAEGSDAVRAGGADAAVAAPHDAPRAVPAVGTAGRFLFVSAVVVLSAWVLVPISLMMVNALSSPPSTSGRCGSSPPSPAWPGPCGTRSWWPR